MILYDVKVWVYAFRHEAEFITANTGFRRYPGLRVQILQQE